MTVVQPIAMGSDPPHASMTLSPCRQAGRLSIITLLLPLVTKPGPCGTGPEGKGQMCMSAMPAIADMVPAAAAPAAALMPSV
jgi:hypothetical protein